MPSDLDSLTEEQPPPGRAWCEARTAAVDEAIAQRMAAASSTGLSVIALGGYARRQLCPASDVDLLLLHDGTSKQAQEQLVQDVVYPLWDDGMSVGYSVHTARDVLRKAREQVDSATALVDRRLVAGDPGLADQLTTRVARMLRQDGGRLALALADADAHRRRKAGEQAGLLEPNLKNGAGGLRDLASLRWAAAALLGEARLDRLVGARYVGAAEYHELTEAEEMLLAVRCGLHLALGTRRPGSSADRLSLDSQDAVAALLGFADGDELLSRVGLAMRSIAHAHQRVWPRLLDDTVRGRGRRRPAARQLGDAVRLVDGYVELDFDRPVAGEPGLSLQAAVAAARNDTHLGRATAARLRRETEGRTLPWTAAARDAFVDLLHEGVRGRGPFADLDHAGLLVALLPGWERVRGRAQRNPYHRYDLDTHAREAVVELVALSDEHTSREVWDGLGELQRLLLLAALLHDVGKAWEGDHSEVGATIASDWLLLMGFDQAQAEWVSRLVRHHLLLPDTATRRDLSDQAEIGRVARVVGDSATLDGLYLLALADGRATGPSASSPWRELLIAELHARVRAVLEPGAATPAAPRTQDAPPSELLSGGIEPGHARVAVSPGPAESTMTVHVVAHDRPGLLADCAGALAARGIPVLDVWAETHELEGAQAAVDRFVVEATLEADWQSVAADLRTAADGRLELDDRLERLDRRAARATASRDRVVPEVLVDAAGDALRIEVHAADRPGLLYRLTRALTDAGLEVVGARAQTLGREVRDVFFCRLDSQQADLAGIEDRLRDAVEPAVTRASPG